MGGGKLGDLPLGPLDRVPAAQLITVDGAAAVTGALDARVTGGTMGSSAVGHDVNEFRSFGDRHDVVDLPGSPVAAPADSAVVLDDRPGEGEPSFAGGGAGAHAITVVFVKRSDIPDEHVIELARRWQEDDTQPDAVTALVAEGVPEKVAVAKVLHMGGQGLLRCEGSAYYAWPA